MHDLSWKTRCFNDFAPLPKLVLDAKNAPPGLVKEKIDQVKTAQVLILDDIGAEQSSP